MNKKHLEDSIHVFQVIAKEQEEKGIVKYGKPLDPLDDYDWLDMAAEELVDGFKYLVAEKKNRQHIVNRIRELIMLQESGWIKEEINSLLDMLEGGTKK
ncbi:hypothetical protein [Paucisalibacillus globulus]|uniref:hypothetical protein n=1 Tax=Paucisalibacillus globulus TaxID=351095 RepID=UPI000424B995|nr:hypothetical protein [Paucisalibacillus globulus]